MFLVGGKSLCWSIAEATELAHQIHKNTGIIVSIERIEQ